MHTQQSSTMANQDMARLYHLLDQEVLANPYPLYHRLRRGDPVRWDPFLYAWGVTRYADALSKRQVTIAVMGAANRDPERFPEPDRLN